MQRYALEACRRIIVYAFNDLKLPLLLGGAVKDNPRSARFQGKLGYRVAKNLLDDDFVTLLVNTGNPEDFTQSTQYDA